MQLSHHQHRGMPADGQGHSSPSAARTTRPGACAGWLLCKLAGLEFEEEVVSLDDPSARAELLLLSPSFLVPCLTHDGVRVWDTLAIAEYLAEIVPQGRPAAGRPGRARALPGDLRRDAFGLLQPALGAADEPQGASSGLQGVGRRAGRHRARDGDLARVPRRATAGPTCSASLTMADAMYAPVCTRFRHLRREARPRSAPPTAQHHELAGHGAMDRRRQGRARRARRARRRVLSRVRVSLATFAATLSATLRMPDRASACRGRPMRSVNGRAMHLARGRVRGLRTKLVSRAVYTYTSATVSKSDNKATWEETAWLVSLAANS